MSFTAPWALQISSSSSLVQEKGRPDTNSLCFSRAVLYLNTYGGGRGLTPGPAQLPTPQGQASSTGWARAGSGCKELLTRPAQVPHFSKPSLPPLENSQNKGHHSPSLGEGRKVTHQALGAAPSLLTTPRREAVTRCLLLPSLVNTSSSVTSPA